VTERSDPPIGISDPAAEVLRAAYYYALVDGHQVVDASQVLVAAARNDEGARTVLGQQVADARTTMTRRERPDSADGVGHAPSRYARALREARWWVLRGNAREGRASGAGAGDGQGAPEWSGTVGTALDRATGPARSAGVTRLDVPHLLLGLLDSADSSVGTLVSGLGLNVDALRRKIRAGGLAVEPPPFTPLIDPLQVFGAIEDRSPWLVRWIPRMVARLTARQTKWGGPVLACLEREVMRQAVLMGHDTVQTSAVLLAIASLDAQLEASGHRLRKAYLPHNQGGRVLADAGFDLHQAQSAAEPLVEEAETLPLGESSERFWDTGKPGDPAWGVAAAQVIDRSAEIARERRHRDVGTSHLLAAVLAEEEDGAAAHLLSQLRVDHRQVRQRIADQLAES
jgi:hypothetical protein